MAQETIFGDGSRDVIDEVVKALESAGVTGDVAAAVTNNLRNGGIEVVDEEIDDGFSLSENARFIIEKRYIRRGDDGEPVEDVERLFRRVSGAIA